MDVFDIQIHPVFKEYKYVQQKSKSNITKS